MDRDFGAVGGQHGAHNPLARPPGRDFLAVRCLIGPHSSSLAAHIRLAEPMDRDLGASWRQLGAHNPLAGPMDQDFLNFSCASCFICNSLSVLQRELKKGELEHNVNLNKARTRICQQRSTLLLWRGA